jgi:hypothetical protein
MADERNPNLRASDADRERVASQLREHCAVGRLTMAELDERLGAAYASRTLGELREVTSDLPEIEPELPFTSQQQHARREVTPRPAHLPAPPPPPHGLLSLPSTVVGWLATSAILTLIWLLTSAPDYFWPVWPIGFGAVGLAGNYLRRNSR